MACFQMVSLYWCHNFLFCIFVLCDYKLLLLVLLSFKHCSHISSFNFHFAQGWISSYWSNGIPTTLTLTWFFSCHLYLKTNQYNYILSINNIQMYYIIKKNGLEGKPKQEHWFNTTQHAFTNRSTVSIIGSNKIGATIYSIDSENDIANELPGQDNLVSIAEIGVALCS